MNPSTVLPVARFSLRSVIVLNWMFGAAILVLLTATIVAREWTFTALGLYFFIVGLLPGRPLDVRE